MLFRSRRSIYRSRDFTRDVHELTNADLLRDVFVWAYERSCQRYIAIPIYAIYMREALRVSGCGFLSIERGGVYLNTLHPNHEEALESAIPSVHPSAIVIGHQVLYEAGVTTQIPPAVDVVV